MTAYGRCPECGEDARACAHPPSGEQTGHDADAPGEGRAAGDGAAPDGEPGAGQGPEDPLHIRPYVRLRESAPEDEAPAAPADPVAGPTVALPVTGPQTAPMPDLSPFARQGTDETAELPTVVASRKSGKKGRAAAAKAARDSGPGPEPMAEAQSAPASHRRTGDRRRPTTAVLAGVGVAAVLGAGLLTTQILTGDDSAGDADEGRALRHAPTGAPTHALPSESPSPSARKAQPEEHTSPSALPSRTSASGTPRADRDSDAHGKPSAGEPEKKPSSDAPSRPSAATESRPGDDRPSRPDRPERPSGPTLQPGDSGPAVAELQRRLKQAGFLADSADEDGLYSSEVRQGVFRYQARYHLYEDTPGDYGPATRRHLEARTSG